MRINILRQAFYALFILSICRLIWFIPNADWLPKAGFSEIFYAFLCGIYFDLPVLAYLWAPAWLWALFYPAGNRKFPKTTRLIFTIPAAIALLLNSIDAGYSRITAKRSGFELYNILSDDSNHFWPYVRDYYPGILTLLLAFWLIYKFTPVKGDSLYIYDPKKYGRLLLLPLVAGIWLLAARGGTRLKPLRGLDAGEYAPFGYSALVNSTPLQIMGTLGQKSLPEFRFIPEADAEKLVLPQQYRPKGGFEKNNVVLIIVESLGRDYTGFLNGKPYTPFLDSLSRKCMNFRFCYATGTRSIDMVPSIFCGLPALSEEQYINSIYATNRMKNLFSQMEDAGYQTGFYHGGANGTMGFQSFLGQTGLKHYFGLNEYPAAKKNKDHDGHWGIFDEPYLQYFANELDHYKTPFFSAVFTLSSHHPYTVPAQYSGLPKGPLPIHQSIAYTDLCLRKFFERAAQSPWYKNTLFVITGDHTSYGTEDYFYSPGGHYEIPLLLYKEGMKPTVQDKTVSQTDIGPTLLDMLGIRQPWFSMGRSAFDSSYTGYALHYDAGVYYMVRYPWVLGIDAQGHVRDFSKHPRNVNPVPQSPQTGPIFDEMNRTLRACMQVYSDRIRNNRWQTTH